MAASDTDQERSSVKKSTPDLDKKDSTESSKYSRNSKHHHSRSRSRSRDRDRKRKSNDKKHKRSRSKEARRKDSEEKSSKSHKSEDQHDREHITEKGRERLSSENGEDRHRRKEKKLSRGRSFSRSRSRERRHRSRSRDRKKSRSRSREKRSRSRDRKRRVKSRSRSRSKHRHRSRSKSKSRERKKRTEKVRRYSRSRSRTASPPAFRGRNTAMDAQEALARRLERAKKLQEQKEKEMVEKQEIVAAVATGGSVLNVAALLASGTQVTPQIAMAAQMAALQAKTLAETGIAVPSYYNPTAVNPMKFAEQEKKRKKLWQGKKEGDKSQTAELWEKLNFGNKDQNVKFRKLMGIKGEDEIPAPTITDEEGLRTLKQQEEVFRNLDVQYEMARSQTHTQRGMGLGFGSSMRGMDAV
ncbi:arginine/serine-rich coiled-coil protein 2-like isoform X3 [Acipenser oxyrinchus oxyrinchus]|uniref:Arginine/serine-rich coiled-coil protein 2 n=1 Tax=Acipenser oxyrinchus oxyrinchus TaxID=40147 RepID=A0AAD8D0H2_ACIOX|nr:arginine/serine-rich coiled-coil protein 2-like isoform X3 [Acipenser oxyrinchus oxyrinchus]